MVEPISAPAAVDTRKPISPLVSLLLGLLVVLGTAGFAYQTELGVDSNRQWVSHTYEVRSQLQLLQTRFAETRASALAFVATRDDPQRREFRANSEGVPSLLEYLRALTADNPRQQARLAELNTVSSQYLADLSASVDASPKTADQHGDKPSGAAAAVRALDAQESRIELLLRSMSDEEQSLLETRLAAWNGYFNRSAFILAMVFLVALLFLSYNYRLLNREVLRTRELEQLQRESARSSRALSTRVLELQDAERRKVARELHDSVGQYLVGLKINMEALLASNTDLSAAHLKLVSDTVDLTDRAITEVRTISHLLHPPLLDEVGFESAAKWYAEGFAHRSGLVVNAHFAQFDIRLSRDAELALFRILQESLTNVHRHANAKTIWIDLTREDQQVCLCVRDDGIGISREVLQRFRSGLVSGVGLAGMRQRIAELGGALEVQADQSGTELRATVPLENQSHQSKFLEADAAVQAKDSAT
jgi:signal transduction histidine kinase